jgi:hypothetical protein
MESVQTIYKTLGYKSTPFKRKKSVVPPAEIKKMQLADKLGLSG